MRWVSIVPHLACLLDKVTEPRLCLDDFAGIRWWMHGQGRKLKDCEYCWYSMITASGHGRIRDCSHGRDCVHYAVAGTSKAGIVLPGVKLRVARGVGALLGDAHVAICRRR